MKLSVMMITYNHEKFIAQAIESALEQKVNFDYELVIGEDCSTDRTRSVITDFKRRYSRNSGRVPGAVRSFS
jgi:glycosyltransferase involved in cell wall biosynthesis